MVRICTSGVVGALLAAVGLASPALAQDQAPKEPWRTRIGLGAQVEPGYPGEDRGKLRPLVSVSRARGDRLFDFEAPDESFGFPVVRSGKFALGPALAFQGRRSAKDVGGNLPSVGFTLEAGAFAQYSVSDHLRVRAEVRKGLGGHKGLVSDVGADFISRDGDKWLFSIGPRVTIADRTYQAAYFAVTPIDAVASGLQAYSARGGLVSAGAAASYLTQVSSRWGLNSYAKYERLVGNAARSPIVTNFGSRNQFSGGLAATYTFGGPR